MKLNIDKCHLLLNSRELNTTEISNLFIKSSYEKLPGIIGIVSLITQDCILYYFLLDMSRKRSTRSN